MGGTVERAEKEQIERAIDHELGERFTQGAVQRAVLLEHGEDPAIGPGQLMVRVFVPAPDEPADYERALAAWQGAHRAAMDQLRRELSLRLPAARLLEFTFDDPGGTAPRITMPDDGSLAAEQMSGREIVTTALSLLRANCAPTTCSPRSPSRPPPRSRPGWRPVSTTTWTRLRSPNW
jgi:hypothetical protein